MIRHEVRAGADRPKARPTPRPDDREPQEHRPLWWYARILRHLKPEGGRLLQYGCGDGALLKLLASHFEAFGYDDDALARHRCRTNVPDAVVLESLADIADESADAVVWIGAIPRQQALAQVRELRRAMDRDAWMVLITPNPGGLGRRLKGARWLAQTPQAVAALPTQGEWMMVLRRAGLEVAAVHGDGLWNAPYVGFIPSEWQRAMFGVPLALSSWLPLSRWLLPAPMGESLVLAARRKS